jgi:hypothetical protein
MGIRVVGLTNRIDPESKKEGWTMPVEARTIMGSKNIRNQ